MFNRVYRLNKRLFIPLFFALALCVQDFAYAAKEPPKKTEKGYTINFDNVPIQEFLRFISKIAKINIIYNEEDLNFNVTIVSEEETDLQNIMSALVQVLRINGLTLIEEEQNLLIHRNEDVKQIPTVIPSDVPISSKMKPTIMTKVFKIEKGNPSHIASLISPMLSKEAMVEVSSETRQLIITDVASSLETVQDLLKSLDAPETPYDIHPYSAKFVSAQELALMAKQILAPISESTTLELVVQPGTQTIYIVSTPFMIQRSEHVLKELDRESMVGAKRALSEDNLLIYRLKFKPLSAIEEGLKKVISEAKMQGFDSPSLLATIHNSKYIESTHSMMFVGPPADLKIISNLLIAIDSSDESDFGTGSSFFLYESSDMSTKELKLSLKEIAEQLKKSGYTHPSVIISLEHAQIIEAIDAFLFTGSPETLAEVKALLSAIEASYVEDLKKTSGSKFLIYNIKQANEEQIRKSLHHLADHLESNKVPNRSLIDAIDSMRWLQSTNSLLFIGNAKSLMELNDLLPNFDLPPSTSKSPLHQIPLSTNFIIYSPKHISTEYLKEAISATAHNLKSADLSDPGLIKTLESMRILKSTDQLIFTGDAESLQKLSAVLAEIDQENAAESMREGPFFIQLKNVHYSQVRNALEKMAQDFSKQDPIRHMVDTMRYLSDANILVLRGSQDALKRIREVIDLTDNESAEKTSGARVEFISLENRPVRDIITILHETAAKLKRSDSPQEELIKTLEEAQAMSHSNTIIISGSDANIAKVRQLIASNDQPFREASNTELFVYKLKYMSASELKTSLDGIAEHAHQKNPSDATSSLASTIHTMRPIPGSDAVQFVGPPLVLVKLKEIIAILDTADNVSSKTQKYLGAAFLVYNVKNTNPIELLEHLKQISKDSLVASQDENLIRAIGSGRYAKESNSLVFSGDKASLDKIQQLLDKLDSGENKVGTPWRTAEGYKLYRPEFVAGQQLVQMAKNFEAHLVSSGVTDHGLAEVIDHLSYIPRTNTIIVSGPTDEIDKVLALLKEFDNPQTAQGNHLTSENGVETIDDTGFLLYKLQHQNGDGLVGALQQISSDLSGQGDQKKNQPLVDAIKSVQYIAITNTLMATGQPKVLTKLRDLLESMDRPLKQLFLEILVIETSTDHELDFGLRWGTQGANADNFAWGTGNYAPTDGGGFPKSLNQITGTRVPTGSDIPPIAGGFMGVIGDVIWHKGKSYASLGSMVNALKSDGDTTVVLSQRIICQDNQNAKIFSGDNVPFTGSLVTTSGLTQTQNANLEYRNIGVTVSITPLIGDNGVITLDIDHEISEEVNTGSDDTSAVSSTTVTGLRTSRTTMTTKAHMPDKHFLVLSGTMRNQITRTVTGIPCLGGLPLIGAAFSSTNKLTVNRNVIMFVKPQIINSNEEHFDITERQEELYGGRFSNSDDFQSAVEIIRGPEDEDYEDE